MRAPHPIFMLRRKVAVRLKAPLNTEARAELLGRIGSHQVSDAFDCLVSGMSETELFEMVPNLKGPKKSLHFSSGKVSYFAFIANKSWLLWYFRRPGLNDGVFTFEELLAEFPWLEFSKRKDPRKVEAMLRISSVEEAESVLHFVRKCKALGRLNGPLAR